MPQSDLTHLPSFWRDRRGTSAVEFAIVSMPFISILLLIMQMSIYYMAQSSLDAGVIQTADYITNQYNSGTAPTFTASSIKTYLLSKSGGMISATNLAVDLKQFEALTSAPVAIVDGAFDSPGASKVLALRTQGQITTFMPGFGAFATVRSSALLHRQGF